MTHKKKHDNLTPRDRKLLRTLLASIAGDMGGSYGRRLLAIRRRIRVG